MNTTPEIEKLEKGDETILRQNLVWANPLKRALKSPLIWILLVLVFSDICLNVFKPLRYVRVPGILLSDQDPINHRIEALVKRSDRVNVFLLGTSLADSAAANADALYFNLKLTDYDRGRYTDSRYFDRQLNKSLTKIESKSINVGVGGSMVSGQEIILDKSLTQNTKPSPHLVVSMIAPRAFVDNTRTIELDPIHCYFNNRFKDISKFNSWQEGTTNLLAKSWTFFNLRGDYRTVLTRLACQVFDRPENAYSASTHNAKPGSEGKIDLSFEDDAFDPNVSNKGEWVKTVKDYYSSAYGKHIDRAKFAKQVESFSRSLKSLKERNIPTIIVSMPLSLLNRRQIPDSFETEYKQTLLTLSEKYDTKLIYLLDDQRFELADYRDGVHLNGPGAIKYWNILVEEIAKDKALVVRLTKIFNGQTQDN